MTVKDGVCQRCGSGVLNSGEHIRDDLPPCFGRQVMGRGRREFKALSDLWGGEFERLWSVWAIGSPVTDTAEGI